ncbi:MAG: hypothetical protein FWG98_01190 [Candidatus Cloacimonetes bacterium]|nr:hypothetical protein [Candidatus Cloacimonadota bacterium]
MKYEYKTWLYDPRDAKGQNQAIFVENKINQMASSGWEYMNSLATGGHTFALLVFRKLKD